jgi:hypothetical protein
VSSQATTHERQSVRQYSFRATDAWFRTDPLGSLTSESPEPERTPSPTTYSDASRSAKSKRVRIAGRLVPFEPALLQQRIDIRIAAAKIPV